MTGDSLGCFKQRGHLSPGPWSCDQNLRRMHFWTPTREESSSWAVWLSVAVATWAPPGRRSAVLVLVATGVWEWPKASLRLLTPAVGGKWRVCKSRRARHADTSPEGRGATALPCVPQSCGRSDWVGCPGTRVHVFSLLVVHGSSFTWLHSDWFYQLSKSNSPHLKSLITEFFNSAFLCLFLSHQLCPQY